MLSYTEQKVLSMRTSIFLNGIKGDIVPLFHKLKIIPSCLIKHKDFYFGSLRITDFFFLFLCQNPNTVKC